MDVGPSPNDHYEINHDWPPHVAATGNAMVHPNDTAGTHSKETCLA